LAGEGGEAVDKTTTGGTVLDREDLEALYELARKLLQLQDYDQMLDVLVQDSLRILGGERGFLVLEKGTSLDFKVVRNWSREELEGEGEPISRSILRDVLERGAPTLVEDAGSDARFASMESVVNMGIRSVLAAPLEVDGEVVGALYLETRLVKRLFGDEQFEVFKRILELSSRALETTTKRLLLEQRTSLLERDLLARYDFPGIIGRDPAFLKVLTTVARVASAEAPVLVQGPPGTGKELVVRALHLNSRRAKQPLVTINCGAIAPTLLESELFGHARGAFTGAVRDKVGLIPSAEKGTVFLDEVGELPLELQPKLLRTIQFGEVQPPGGRSQTVDVRFIAATNCNLEQAVAEGRFRQDLFDRLNVIFLELPPLRDRPADILPLFYHFLNDAAQREGRPVPPVTPRLERALQQYSWPGNIRQLENEARRLLAITEEGTPLTVDSLSTRITTPSVRADPAMSLAEKEKELIELHLRRTGGNRTQAARGLGISREGLRKKMNRYGLE
jgi:transcriptional regulator with GAF, ATPase, and Fis domain